MSHDRAIVVSGDDELRLVTTAVTMQKIDYLRPAMVLELVLEVVFVFPMHVYQLSIHCKWPCLMKSAVEIE